MTAAADREHGHPTIGMRELSQRTAKIMALVRAGATVEVTDRGRIVARIVPAADDRYAQLVAAGVIRPAKRPFDIAHLPQPAANPTGLSTEDWLADLRGER
ncbi:MAG: type II toxin-antitoxin system Phd/YefM family antitoxin [Pseudonocardiaceae bacterium]